MNDDSNHIADVLGMILIRLGTLAKELSDANRVLEEAVDDQSSRRDAIMWALLAVKDFLHSFDDLRSQGLSKPLQMLLVALSEVDEGKRDPLFEPAKRSSRPPDTTFEAGCKAAAAAAMTLLMENGAPEDNAAASVARQMAKSGYRLAGGRHPSGTTIRHWREECIGHHGGTPMGTAYDSAMRIARDKGMTDEAAALRLAAGAGSGKAGLVSAQYPTNPEKPPS